MKTTRFSFLLNLFVCGISLILFTTSAFGDYSTWQKAINAGGAHNVYSNNPTLEYTGTDTGVTGRGVVVGILDSGVEPDHPLLQANIDATIPSVTYLWDKAPPEIVTGPQGGGIPLYDNGENGAYGDAHGTAVASCVIGANNDFGLAAGATLVSNRMDFGLFHSVETMKAILAYGGSDIQVKNSSWGVSAGYGSGYGTIANSINDQSDKTVFVFSAGNERAEGDVTNGSDANKKAMQASPYGITVAATGGSYDNYPDYSTFASFSCFGANVFVSAPGRGIATADRQGAQGYNTASGTAGDTYPYFNGTSASAPIVSGAIATTIEALNNNPNIDVANIDLTRTIKHLIVQTAQKIDTGATGAEAAWKTNGANIMFSPTYGFGQIDAGAMAKLAAEIEFAATDAIALAFDWTNYDSVQKTHTLTPGTEKIEFGSYDKGTHWTQDSLLVRTASAPVERLAPISMFNNVTADDMLAAISPNAEYGNGNGTLKFETTVSFDSALLDNLDSKSLEAVALTLGVSADDLGSVQIELTSPSGTKSILAYAEETFDGDSKSVFDPGDILWTYTSNEFWGENPTGEWTLEVYDMYNLGAMSVIDSSLSSVFYLGHLGDAISPNNPDPTAVPEPATWGLLLAGMLLLVRFRRTRKIA